VSISNDIDVSSDSPYDAERRRYATERSLAEAQAAIIAAGQSAAGAVGSLRVDRGREPISV